MNKYIVATSGGFISTKRWGVVKPGATFLKALELTKKDRPKVCFIMTASGDDNSYIARSYEAMSSLSVDVTHLSLFPQPNADAKDRVLKSDLIWVGENVTNTLANNGSYVFCKNAPSFLFFLAFLSKSLYVISLYSLP